MAYGLSNKETARSTADAPNVRRIGGIGLRTSSTPTWVANGEWRQLERVPFGEREFSEDFLQASLAACPQLLPIEDFDDEFGPLVSLGREVDYIDNLFVSPSGRLTIVETKLWRNPQSTREVIAQVLEYATRVSRWDYEQLESNWRAANGPSGAGASSLYEVVRSQYPAEVSSESEFHDAVQRTLETGRFLLLVVGDGIRAGLENLLESLHANPSLFYVFGLIELQLFRDAASPDERLIVPRVLARCVEDVRAVVRVTGGGQATVSLDMEEPSEGATAARPRRRLSEEDFYDQIGNPAAAVATRDLLARVRELGATVEPRSNSVSVRLKDPRGSKQRLSLFVVTTTAEIYTGWLADQLESIGSDPAIAADWLDRLERLFPGVRRKPDFPDELAQNIPVTAVAPVLDQFIDNLGSVIEAIRASVE